MIVYGIALEPHAITHGSSGVEKTWPADELRDAVDSLDDRPITSGDGWTPDNKIGRVNGVEYRDGKGVWYEAIMYDREIGGMVERGELQLAPRLTHDRENKYGKIIAKDITFDGLFTCPAASDGVPELAEWTVIA